MANVVHAAENLQNTCESILERNRLNVLCVTNDSPHHVPLRDTPEFTAERNRIRVMNVGNVFQGRRALFITAEFIVVRNHINVTYVRKNLVSLVLYAIT